MHDQAVYIKKYCIIYLNHARNEKNVYFTGLSYFQITYGYIGMCAFPCSLQGKSLEPVIGGIFQPGSVIGEYGSEDPSILTFTFTNKSISEQEIWECYARSGPFFAYK